MTEKLIDTPLGKKRMSFIVRSMEQHEELVNALQRLAEKVRRADNIRHSGGRLRAEDWSELHQLTNEAYATLAKARESSNGNA